MTIRDKLFPKEVQLAAQHSQRATGVPSCLILSQWALESAYGKKLSGNYNYFGIKGNKANGKPCKTKEFVNGKFIDTIAYFRNFASLDEAFSYHGKHLSNPKGPYKDALPYIDDWQEYTKRIAAKYATDYQYANKLIKIINTCKLYELNLPQK